MEIGVNLKILKIKSIIFYIFESLAILMCFNAPSYFLVKWIYVLPSTIYL